MARKKESEGSQKGLRHEIRDETLQAILAIFSFLLALLSLLAAFGKAGIVGEYTFIWLSKLFGFGYYLIPAILIILAFVFLRGIKKKFETSKAVGAIVLFISGLGFIDIMQTNSGGVAGRWIAAPLLKLLDVWASTALLIALAIISIFVIFEARITIEQLKFWKWFRKKDTDNGKKAVTGMDESEEAQVEKAVADVEKSSKAIDSAAPGGTAATKDSVARQTTEMARGKKDRSEFDDEENSFGFAIQAPLLKPFTPPPISLLEKDRGKPETGDIKANANIIKRTLQNFGITVEMDEISIGPSVTRYALKPAEGVKLSKIVALNNDLALALAAHPIRIEAPIPGKSLVGIEVPNTAKTTVGLATILASAKFKESEKPLLASLGKDITGGAHFVNLAKAPHMLVAGATGSGKSVAIHALITSLLYRNSPENLKFILIDPKRVELTLYNKIPHLLTPVITEAKKAILALKWAAKEMSRRYDILEQSAARDIDSYHRNIVMPAIEKLRSAPAASPSSARRSVSHSASPRSTLVAASTGEAAGADAENANAADRLPETMPYIVIVIDELADIMQAYPRELEAAVVRLAQMSRAVGIHLVLSTQRPSVNVITGLIKANIPTRIALQVASQIDSRTILDQMGAEKLLGAGDMLYLGGEMSKPVRLQSAFISESEVKRVVKFLADQYKDEIMSEISLTTPEAGSSAAFDAMMDNDSLEEEDELYETARESVMAAGKASTSYIQRKLGVGYSRAAKLMDMLEEKGVIGPANGSKPREVIGKENSGEAGESL
ncbi:DNA translocase FtsK [Patescibacteria group bacterium]|nr:DNA translocase FtsK [Patescibacteria group bacterium]MDE1946404.1 DNA translocase FtsK [Patescibacteria group bacterium]MDE2011013.1 DNA translocase FtsK [Patescibacteria group bacterium]MDE2233036.1 DNA translocase FtsK [Patescibacteria group bacterium]